MKKRPYFVCLLCMTLSGMLAGCFERGPTKSELNRLFKERLKQNDTSKRFFGDCAKGDGDYYLCEACEAYWDGKGWAILRKYRIKRTVENDIGWDFRVRINTSDWGGGLVALWGDSIAGEKMPENDIPKVSRREVTVGWCHSKGFR